MENGIDWKSLNSEIVFVAENGCEVKDYLSGHSVDILILDIEMPGCTGIELASWVYESEIPSKIIFLTAYSNFQYARAALSYAVIEYVLKEDYMETLMPAVRKAIATIESRSDVLINFVEKLLMQTATEKEKISFLSRWKETEFVTLIFKFDSKIGFFEADAAIHTIQENFKECNIIMERLSLYEYLCLVPARCETINKRCRDIILSIETNLHMPCKVGISSVKKDMSLLRESFLEAYEAINNIYASDVLSYDDVQRDDLVRTACVIIDKEYGNTKLSLRTIAKEMHINASYLSRKFSKETGVTITEYINQLRIKKAAQLLENTNMFVYEVAERVGIDDSAYFSELFKKYIGVSPKNYKKES